MSATLLSNELSSLSSEAKRKNGDLRAAADKSLQELKSLPSTSEQQLAADLSRRPAFIEPFLIACKTRNAKFAASGISCLQRLVISKGLPRSRLNDAIEAFNSCTDLGLDVQLKILQALPSLLQNYAVELEGELLSGALQVCSSLQAAKASTVSGVASATLQQLVTTVFEKVASEDDRSHASDATIEVAGVDGPLHLRPAAFDAYRVFRDLALAADERKTKFVQFASLSADSSLELIWSCIDSNPELFEAHDELMSIIGSNVFPIIVRALSEKLPFSVTVRSIRLLDLVMDRYMSKFAGDCEVALSLCMQALEPDAAPAWKRAIVMEILRDFFADSSHALDAFVLYDHRDGGRPIVQDIMSMFVRLSTEKPSAIGLGQQSTVPTGPPERRDNGADVAALEAAGGMGGVLSSALGVAETNVPGISAQWSLLKQSCMDQLDKSDAPAIPETYLYALVLECFNGLSDSLARVVLPLTVQHEKNRSKNGGTSHGEGRKRSTSFRTQAVPVNPLEVDNAPYAVKIRAVASLIDSCWPAVLATASTFLNAALDDQYFRNLIKSYQRFAQVAGLLRLKTPRDALMTSLSKAAVPPHILNAATSEFPRSPVVESPRSFSNPKAMLSVDSLVSQTTSLSLERKETVKPMLTVRNLLCLRALLNLAIALGPTLESSFAVIVNALKQADMVLSTTTPREMTRQSSMSGKQVDEASVVQAFSSEVAAVEAAASRLLESTADYPSDAFLNVLTTFSKLLHSKSSELPSPTPGSPDLNQSPSPPSTPTAARRTLSGLPGISNFTEIQLRDYQFVIPKLGTFAELNVSRFTSDDATISGWNILVDELISVAKTHDSPREARRSATNVLVKLSEATSAEVMKEEPDDRAVVQRRSVSVLLRLINAIYSEDGDLTAADLEVQHHVLDSLRAILERSGDSLIAGWDCIVAIIGSAFAHEGAVQSGGDECTVNIDWTQVSFELVSTQIGRVAFAAIQLVCSDFSRSIPTDVMPSLIELLYRFMCQKEDLNASLTTVTMVWNLSDVIFDEVSRDAFGHFIEDAQDFDELEADVQDRSSDSQAAQWLSLLLRLTDAAARPQNEIRNAAFQTICNVLKTHGHDLSPLAWDVLLRCTLLNISRADSFLYLAAETGSTELGEKPDTGMSKAIIIGISMVLSQHLQMIEQIARLPSLWEMFLGMLERYRDIEDHALNAEVYHALSRVLASVDPSNLSWKGPIYRTVSLWLKGFPRHQQAESGEKGPSNQEAFQAYAEAGEELYRLTRDTMSTSQTRTMIENLYQCVQESDAPLYGADVATLSPLQARILQLLKSIRHDLSNIPSCLATVAAKLAILHHETTDGTKSSSGPTFVAIASEAIDWLWELLQTHIADQELLESGALTQAVQGLSHIITTKYTYRLEHKGHPLWRKATVAAVGLARLILDQISQPKSNTAAKHEILAEYVTIANGIVGSTGIQLVDNEAKLGEDVQFDIEKFHALRTVLMPRLGDADVSAKLRGLYTRALFTASIITQPEFDRITLASSEDMLSNDVLAKLSHTRRGRVKHLTNFQREDMCYVCWKELLALSTSTTAGSAQCASLAQAAAPLLILRLAIPLRAYVADQPLRGRRPQPLVELDELNFALESIETLRLVETAMDGGERAHVKLIYPLLVKALGTAGDPWSGSLEVSAKIRQVLDKIGPV